MHFGLIIFTIVTEVRNIIQALRCGKTPHNTQSYYIIFYTKLFDTGNARWWLVNVIHRIALYSCVLLYLFRNIVWNRNIRNVFMHFSQSCSRAILQKTYVNIKVFHWGISWQANLNIWYAHPHWYKSHQTLRIVTSKLNANTISLLM